MEYVIIRILPKRDFYLPYNPTDFVSDLKFKFSTLIQIPMKRLTFCFNGKVLADPYEELQHIGIKNQSIIFLVISMEGKIPIIVDTPVSLMHKLISYVNALFNIPYDEFVRTEKIIRDLLNNEFLQFYGKINPEAQASIDEVEYMMQNIQRPYSDSTFLVLSKLQDLVFDQFEGSSDGFRCITSGIADVSNDFGDDVDDMLIEEDDEDENNETNEYENETFNLFNKSFKTETKETNLSYETKISSEPLPVPTDSPGWRSLESFSMDSDFMDEKFDSYEEMNLNDKENYPIKAL